jgi:hypothetical protein
VFFLACVLGVVIYLGIDTFRNYGKLRRAALENSVAEVSSFGSTAIRQLEYKTPSKPRRIFPRPSERAIYWSAGIVFSAFFLSFAMMVVYEHYEYRPRQAILTFVNPDGSPMRIDRWVRPPARYDLGDDDDSNFPFFFRAKGNRPKAKIHLTFLAGNVVMVEWNCPGNLYLWEMLGEGLSVNLNDDESSRVVRPPPIVPTPGQSQAIAQFLQQMHAMQFGTTLPATQPAR